MPDIIDRLRNRIHDAPMPTERLLDEAADVIELLSRALEPFAKQADTHGEQIPDEMFIDDYERSESTHWVSFAQIRVGELRRARAALTQARF